MFEINNIYKYCFQYLIDDNVLFGRILPDILHIAAHWFQYHNRFGNPSVVENGKLLNEK